MINPSIVEEFNGSLTRDLGLRGIQPILKKDSEFTNVNILFRSKMISEELILSLILVTYLINKIIQ